VLRSRVAVVASYALVLVLSVELALWGAFLVAARPFGTPLPVAAMVAAGGNIGLGLVGARVLGRRAGAAGPGLLWLVIALTLGSRTAEGDVVVTGGLRGLAFLMVGTIAAAAVVGMTGQARAPRATPGAPTGR
jgi:hypothetical protein